MTSHYLNQCWPTCLVPYSTGLQWVKKATYCAHDVCRFDDAEILRMLVSINFHEWQVLIVELHNDALLLHDLDATLHFSHWKNYKAVVNWTMSRCSVCFQNSVRNNWMIVFFANVLMVHAIFADADFCNGFFTLGHITVMSNESYGGIRWDEMRWDKIMRWDEMMRWDKIRWDQIR